MAESADFLSGSAASCDVNAPPRAGRVGQSKESPENLEPLMEFWLGFIAGALFIAACAAIAITGMFAND